MEFIQIKNIKEIKKVKEELEKKLDIKINLKRKVAEIEGPPLNEYEAGIILDAVSFGFSAKKAILLLDSDITFRKINIKDFTRRKNLYDVRARIIGKEGKIKRTIEELSDCELVLHENTLGIIGSAEGIETATTALTSIIKGAKAANVYGYLEKVNRIRRKRGD